MPDGMSFRHDIPVVETLLLDEAKTITFLRQCAMARLINHTTTVSWQKRSGVGLLDCAYAAMEGLTGGAKVGPGFATISGPPNRELRERAQQHFSALMRNFAHHLRQGPASLAPWMLRQQTLFERDMREIRQTILQVRQVNDMVDRDLQRAVFNLTTVKFVSECLLQCLGIMPFGAVMGVVTRLGIGVGYPVLCSFVTDWSRASKAGLVYTAAASGTSAFVVSLPSLLGEQPLVKACKLFFVDRKFEEAAALLADANNKNAIRNALRDQGLRGKALGDATRAASSNLVQQANNLKDAARLDSVGLKYAGIALQGAACWFAYKGAEQSAQEYWRTLEQSGL